MGGGPVQSPPSPARQQQRKHEIQIAPGARNAAALDQSWWGNGSMLAPAAAGNGQRPSDGSGPGGQNQQSSPNTKQIVQLMETINRLWNKNVQLMREVEDARSARAEAKSAREMMAKFKGEYAQRFGKVKEALKKFPQNAGGGDNPVASR